MMKFHNWAAKQMYAGLMIPSDEHWQRGATNLANANLDLWFKGMPITKDKSLFAVRVNTLSAKALISTNQEERADLYGEILVTCNGCHRGRRPNCQDSKKTQVQVVCMADHWQYR